MSISSGDPDLVGFSIYNVFQPIVDVKKNRIFGYEALARGASQDDMPANLFASAYGAGYTMAFDLKCLTEALTILPRLGKKQYLFINVEPVTLGHAFSKGKEIESVLKKIRPYTKRIVFELTERLRPWDYKLVKRGIAFFQHYGCKFALDDVQGLDVALYRLIVLAPDFLKIDRSLTHNLSKRPVQQELVRRLVQIGKKRKIKLIAEGVEQKNDLDFVQDLGIFLAQGYYLAKPNRKLYHYLSRYESSRKKTKA